MHSHSISTSLSARVALWRTALLAAFAGLVGCATVPGSAPPAPGSEATPSAPAAGAPSLGFFSKIKVPDTLTPVARLAGKGVQVFRCERMGTSGALGWVFRVPEADLSDGSGKVVGRHGANFSFEHTDGSRLLGTVTAYDEAPSSADLRWLLITTKPFGDGAFGGVTHVQRVNTSGGIPPERCEANQLNQLLRVGFSADFVFYRPR